MLTIDILLPLLYLQPQVMGHKGKGFLCVFDHHVRGQNILQVHDSHDANRELCVMFISLSGMQILSLSFPESLVSWRCKEVVVKNSGEISPQSLYLIPSSVFRKRRKEGLDAKNVLLSWWFCQSCLSLLSLCMLCVFSFSFFLFLSSRFLIPCEKKKRQEDLQE